MTENRCSKATFARSRVDVHTCEETAQHKLLAAEFWRVFCLKFTCVLNMALVNRLLFCHYEVCLCCIFWSNYLRCWNWTQISGMQHGNGKLECPCHNCYFSISKFVITRLDCSMASGSLGECYILFFCSSSSIFLIITSVSCESRGIN